jgi:hypothetical protein
MTEQGITTAEDAATIAQAPLIDTETSAPAAVASAPAAAGQPVATAKPQPHPSGFAIPDFAEDARVIASFETARERFERAESQAAEDEIRADFKRRRDVIQNEVATADAVIAARETKWATALQAYAKRYPKMVEKSRAKRPGFMQNLMSFGSAGKLHKATVDAFADLNDARSLRRRKEHEDEELDSLQRRALAKLEETLRENAKTTAHLEKFLSRPGNAALAKRVQEIRGERDAYTARLEAGKVAPLEQRDRHFIQINAVPLEAPCTGVAIVGVETYGELCYLIFRDREGKHYYRPFDARLEGLSDTVFDVYRIADRFEAKAHKREGKPMNLADHLTEYLRDDERAKSDARRIRAMLREPRAVKAPEGDRSLMDLLAELAKNAGRFSA